MLCKALHWATQVECLESTSASFKFWMSGRAKIGSKSWARTQVITLLVINLNHFPCNVTKCVHPRSIINISVFEPIRHVHNKKGVPDFLSCKVSLAKPWPEPHGLPLHGSEIWAELLEHKPQNACQRQCLSARNTKIITKLIRREFSPAMFRQKNDRNNYWGISSGSSLQRFCSWISVGVSSDQWTARCFR